MFAFGRFAANVDDCKLVDTVVSAKWCTTNILKVWCRYQVQHSQHLPFCWWKWFCTCSDCSLRVVLCMVMQIFHFERAQLICSQKNFQIYVRLLVKKLFQLWQKLALRFTSSTAFLELSIYFLYCRSRVTNRFLTCFVVYKYPPSANFVVMWGQTASFFWNLTPMSGKHCRHVSNSSFVCASSHLTRAEIK